MSIKEGYLKKWSDTKNWTNVYCKLLQSGWFQWFDSASSTSPKRSVDIRHSLPLEMLSIASHANQLH
ncbi:unnamed protein product [Trichobilharzia szidati]|nr:unnamed protein product [Trichobilharzia szidati]